MAKKFMKTNIRYGNIQSIIHCFLNNRRAGLYNIMLFIDVAMHILDKIMFTSKLIRF